MKFLLWVMLVSSLNGVNLEKVNVSEIPEIEHAMIAFYSEELVLAGTFETFDDAYDSACKEWDEELSTDKVFYYYHITSDDYEIHYGFLVFTLENSMAYVDVIYLEEQYRGQGIGSKTFVAFENVLKEKNVDVIKFYVFDHNVVARDIYLKYGCQIELTEFSNGIPIGYFMTKHLEKS